jgi:hypothetical protein
MLRLLSPTALLAALSVASFLGKLKPLGFFQG